MKQEKENMSGQLNLFDPSVIISKEIEKVEKKQKKVSKKILASEEDLKENSSKEKEDDNVIEEELKNEETLSSKSKEPIEIKAKAKYMHAAMYRMYEDILSKEMYIVAYIDYNQVYWKEKKQKPSLLRFPTAAMAVDFYMEKVSTYLENPSLIEDEDDLILEDVK